jgi:hypothetical protein
VVSSDELGSGPFSETTRGGFRLIRSIPGTYKMNVKNTEERRAVNDLTLEVRHHLNPLA